MTIMNTLKANGFRSHYIPTYCDLWWGTGSLVWGYTTYVTQTGPDLYVVRYHHWDYDEWGEPMVEVEETRLLPGALLLQYIFERLPLWR